MNEKNKRHILATIVVDGSASLLPYTFDPSALGDGALPSPWSGATWTIASGKVINTPNEGPPLSFNGDMEAGDPPTGWTPANATAAADADVHGGSQSIKVTSTSAAGYVTRNISLTAYKWYKFGLWVKRTAGQIDFLITPGASIAPTPYHLSPSSYTNYVGAILTSGASITMALRGFDNGTVAYWDDITCTPLEWAEVINVIDFGVANVSVGGAGTIGSFSPAGVVVNCNSKTAPTHMVFAVHVGSRNYIYMFKMINGTCTQLIGAASTYVSGVIPKIVKTSASVYQLWYNGLQIGTDQTVTDANLNNNTLHGLFSVGGGSQITSFFAVAA